MSWFTGNTVLDIARKQIDIVDQTLLFHIAYYSFLSNLWQQKYNAPFTSSAKNTPFQQVILKLCETCLEESKGTSLPSEDDDLLLNKTSLQAQLERIQTLLVITLDERFQIIELIGKYKHRYNLPIFVPTRWEEVINKMKEQALKYDLNIDKIEKIYKLIHKQALIIEK